MEAIEIPDTDQQREDQLRGIQPIGWPMTVPAGAFPPGTSAAKRILPTGAQPNSVPMPVPTGDVSRPVPSIGTGQITARPAMTVPQASSPAVQLPPSTALPVPQQSAGARLWQAAKNRQNPFAKFLAEAGTGAARALDIAGESLFPRVAEMVPGSELNTSIRNAAARKQAGEDQAMKLRGYEAETAREEANRPKTVESGGQAYEKTPSGWSAIGTPKPPAEKTPTPEESTLQDLMTGNNGQPRINPDTNRPYTKIEAYQAIKRAGQKPQTLTSPFEAYAYGTPEEKKAAQDFIAFEKQQGTRYERPSEIEERYSLYKRDPDAYKQMFGDRGAAQDTRDQEQATRMLNYFAKQRKAIQEDFTLDDAEKQRQLAEIDALEKPYLGMAQPGQQQRPSQQKTGARNAQQYQRGDEVMYKGKRMKVLNVRPDGKLELEAIGAGAR
jgi:hypothetical protein